MNVIRWNKRGGAKGLGAKDRPVVVAVAIVLVASCENNDEDVLSGTVV